MFSIVRVAAVAAVLAVGGSLLLVAGPARPPADPAVVSTVETDALDPEDYAGFGGTWTLGGYEAGTLEETDWGCRFRGERWSSPLEVSDPRISGTWHMILNYDTFTDGASYGVRSVSNTIVNDDGSWTGTGTGFQDPTTEGLHYQVLLTGQGAHEGLSALIFLSQDSYSMTFDVDGVIFPGELPEYPDPGQLPE
jgi:hypothetical protein